MSLEVWHHYAQTTDGLWHRHAITMPTRENPSTLPTAGIGGCDLRGARLLTSYREGGTGAYLVERKCPACEATQ